MRVGQYYLTEDEEEIYKRAREKYREEKGEIEKEKDFFLEVCKNYVEDPQEVIHFIEEERKRREERRRIDKEILERLEREGIGEPALTEKLRERLRG